jgi:four helix bundle protein
MGKRNILKEKSFDFALKVIKVCKELVSEKKEFVLSKQLLRSGTSIGALVRESENAVSTKDFVNKLSIALKEAGETEYWIELLYHSGYIEKEICKELISGCNELISILTASIKTTKLKLISASSNI